MISSHIRMWDGDEWEKYIQSLLEHHYGPGNYQHIPARHGGDFGIEGYSTDGCAYQCYAAQEPLSTKERYEKQRDKITTDIGKFISNKCELMNTFGTTLIRRWILVVPLSESSQLMQHASKKAREVLSAQLPYVTDDFKVIIITDSSFKKEIQELASVNAIDIELPDVEITSEDCDGWIANNEGLVGNLKRKACKINGLDSDEKVDRFARLMISHYLKGQNSLAHFNSNYPDFYARLDRCKRSYEVHLATLSMIIDVSAPQHLAGALEKYKVELRDAVRNLPNAAIDDLGWEGVSDWLMRCPLDF